VFPDITVTVEVFLVGVHVFLTLILT